MNRVTMQRPLITRVASRYGLRPDLVAGMVMVESAGDALAMNPEPKFLERYRKTIEDYVRHCGNRQALLNFRKSGVPWASSYGLLQIMWPVAYERGLRSPWPTILSRPDTGLTWGCKHLAWLLERTDDETKAVASYNGGLGNPRYGYANKVNEAMQEFKW